MWLNKCNVYLCCLYSLCVMNEWMNTVLMSIHWSQSISPEGLPDYCLWEKGWQGPVFGGRDEIIV